MHVDRISMIVGILLNLCTKGSVPSHTNARDLHP